MANSLPEPKPLKKWEVTVELYKLLANITNMVVQLVRQAGQE